jgi:hypothetical protein
MQWQTVDQGKAKDRIERRGCANLSSRENLTMDLVKELQAIYDSEVNLEIGWLWDGGIEVRLGDRMGGFLAEEALSSTAEIVPWLQEAIAHFYPESTYAKAFDADLRSRAALRLFFPPRVGAQVICPRCGAPNAAPAMDQVFISYCARCGESFEVTPSKVQ